MKKAVLLLLVAVLTGGVFSAVRAQKIVRFELSINPGVLQSDVRDPAGRSIADPVVDLGHVGNSSACRWGGNSLSGEFGTDDERIYVDNPRAAGDGWTLAITPLGGSSSLWSGGRHKMDFNDGAGLGCDDSDGDGYGGLLTIDPSDARLEADCLSCSTDNVTLGGLGPSSFAETEAVTLLRANESADELGSWYITGVKVYQTVPAGQAGDWYALEMVLTATAS